MHKNADKLKEAGIRPVSVSYDKVEVLTKAADSLNLDMTYLADPTSNVIRKYGLLDSRAKQGTKFFGMSHATTIVVGRDGKVAAILLGTTRKRHTSDDLTEAVQSQNSNK